MGYASDIYEMISSQDEIKDKQLFFTKLFLDETTRVKERKENLFKIFQFNFSRINGRLYLINVLIFL
jgi:hypothetical protein